MRVELITLIIKLNLKNRILKSSLTDYGNAYMHAYFFQGTISIYGETEDHAVRLANKGNKH